jgi:translation initiation factor IF-2
MIDTSGKPVKQALPGTAVVVSGWKELPEAGEEVLTANESDIRKALANRERRKAMVDLIEDAEAINEQRQADRKRREKEELLDKRTNRGILASAEPVDDGKPQVRELRLVIKADVSGSAEAVEGALEAIGNHQARVKIVHTGVGDVAMSDVDLAKTAGGLSSFDFVELGSKPFTSHRACGRILGESSP